MSGRLAFLLLLGAALLPTPVSAQVPGPMFGPGPGYAPAAPPMMSGGPAGHLPPGFPPGYAPPLPNYYDRPAAPQAGTGILARMKQTTEAALARSWFRTEFMVWSIEDPGAVLIGEPLLTTDDPSQDFPVFSLAEPPALIGTGRVPTLDSVSIEDLFGMRLTYGAPTTFGSFEISGFFLVESEENFQAQDIPELGRFVAISTLINNTVLNRVQLFDQSFQASYRSRLWGLESNLVWDLAPPGEGFKLNPTAGFRILDFNEQMEVIAVNSDNGTLNPPQTARIGVKADNFIFGPSLGLRAQLDHRWFTVGVAPKVTLAANYFDAQASTLNFASTTDPLRRHELDNFIFSPVLETSIFGRAHLHDGWSFVVSYDLLWMSRVVRAGEAVDFDVDSRTLESRTRARRQLTDVLVEGFTFGAEFSF